MVRGDIFNNTFDDNDECQETRQLYNESNTLNSFNQNFPYFKGSKPYELKIDEESHKEGSRILRIVDDDEQ